MQLLRLDGCDFGLFALVDAAVEANGQNTGHDIFVLLLRCFSSLFLSLQILFKKFILYPELDGLFLFLFPSLLLILQLETQVVILFLQLIDLLLELLLFFAQPLQLILVSNP